MTTSKCSNVVQLAPELTRKQHPSHSFFTVSLISHWLEDKFLLCWNPGHLLSDKRTFPSPLELTLLSSQVSGGVTSGQQEMSLLIQLTQNLISTLDFINTKSGFHFFPWTQYLVPRFSPILHWIFKLGNKSSSTCSQEGKDRASTWFLILFALTVFVWSVVFVFAWPNLRAPAAKNGRIHILSKIEALEVILKPGVFFSPALSCFAQIYWILCPIVFQLLRKFGAGLNPADFHKLPGCSFQVTLVQQAPKLPHDSFQMSLRTESQERQMKFTTESGLSSPVNCQAVPWQVWEGVSHEVTRSLSDRGPWLVRICGTGKLFTWDFDEKQVQEVKSAFSHERQEVVVSVRPLPTDWETSGR